MRRAAALLLALALLAALLGGCGQTAQTADKPLTVVATVFPVWDWTRNVLGDTDGPELKLLLENGVDMHSFQPGVDDMVKLSSCDLLIYVGGESDDWIADALAEAKNPNQRALNLMDALGESALAEELREGMQGEADGAMDEHVWMSPRVASLLTGAIAEALAELDPAHAEDYRANCEAYRQQLGQLSERCAEIAGRAAGMETPPVLLVADRFPFRYLTEELGLDYYAAFSGCSAETGASFETIAFLAGQVDARGLRAVFTTESPVPGIADAVVRNAKTPGTEILVLDSMQSVTKAEIDAGASYAEIMDRNLTRIELTIDS